ncbi:hypothetical protein EOD41_03280 [Mucilaginibacter limnophilus]|uniref:DUF4374 domain-containing protein n=1 Tax=Mucilaginibacter limnophilus TaxID=1932778 RepID=A0A3S2URM3_9SPHI|nr:hypothetical protein [Mucilaginibacter limnophilus]RVU02970.1 hypothetical protein EOD41_03280 [Mucilaginibacter limnophilus]
MKIQILFILALATALQTACKKEKAGEPDSQVNPGPVNDPLLFGQTWQKSTSPGVATVWSGKNRDTTIVGYKHSGLIVTGFYERAVISPNGIAKGIDFYGNEVANGNNSRLCQFLQVSTPFATTTGRELNPSYIEWSQGSTTYNDNTYIIALGTYKGQRASSYYYKVSGTDGKPTFHPLAQTPNGNGYAWYCGTEKGLLVSNSLSPDTKKTFLSIYRETQWLQDYKLEAPGYIYIDVENVFAKDAEHLIVIVDAKKEGTPITGLFYFTINLIDHTIKRYQADLPEVNYHINEGAYAKNTVYLPYYENSSNKCAYVTVRLDDKLDKLITEKVDLPVKAGINYGSATLVATKGNAVYTAGEQSGKACYWRNDKLIEIENKDANASVITKIAVFD